MNWIQHITFSKEPHGSIQGFVLCKHECKLRAIDWSVACLVYEAAGSSTKNGRF